MNEVEKGDTKYSSYESFDFTSAVYLKELDFQKKIGNHSDKSKIDYFWSITSIFFHDRLLRWIFINFYILNFHQLWKNMINRPVLTAP